MPKKRLVRVLTQNVGCHFFSPNDPSNRTERLQSLLRHLDKTNLDIVFIQELYSLALLWPLKWASEEKWFKSEMAARGYVHVMDDFKVSPWVGMNSGLLIFSRFPIDRKGATAHVFSNNRVYQHKGFVQCTINIGGVPIVAVSTHLEHAIGSIRTQQLRTLEAHVQSHVDNGRVVIVAGDFNCYVSYLCGYNGLIKGNVATHDNGMSLDNIFVIVPDQQKGKAKCIQSDVVEWKYRDASKGECFLSDHRGAMATMMVEMQDDAD